MLRAQDNAPQLQIDSTAITPKRFDQNFKENYTSADYNYDVMEGEAENLITRALNWFFKNLAELFGVDIDPETFTILRYLIYGVLVIFAIYIVIKLLVGDNASSFFTKKSAQLAPLNVEEEHIENIDINSLIEKALQDNNYRLAIRYMYLKTLKQLSGASKIIWDFEKTNQDYYNEIEDPSLKTTFKRISYLYDYVWYGEFTLNEEDFISAQKDFERVKKHINNAG
ncbi:hypothetical protein ULMS_13970 [Patiriisocius marinistellae]|uniref:DUF4129 domain-containing protein n=1 Tax=Patiriisocius marinistellae TaxID=2494560 RepID=A0A5J4G097_9FLAO|nr:hypothetical protein ULMS_13970 [Patiriisocius marinistellae]